MSLVDDIISGAPMGPGFSAALARSLLRRDYPFFYGRESRERSCSLCR